MKILDVTEFYSERGGGVRSHLTARAHVSYQLGHEHLAIAPGPRDSDEAVAGAPTSRVIRVRGPSLPYDPTYHLLWRIDKIRALISGEHPDVLEIHSPYVAAASALSAPRTNFGIRTFQWHADFIDTYLRASIEARTGDRAADVIVEPLWAMVRTIARGCDATFVAAKWQKAKLDSHGVARVLHVPFGVDRDAFSPAARSEARRRELLACANADEGARLLVAVGRFATEKKWNIVLDAFLKVRAHQNVALVLFGDGPERETMKARVASTNNVYFAGFEKDRARLASALASADALVHGCPFETFGLSIAEAIASGLPVVVPDQGGAAEVAQGIASAAIYPSLDVDACARAVESLLARDALELRATAERAATTIASERDHFTRTFDAYAELLSARRG